MNVQIIKTEAGEELVVLPKSEYEALIRQTMPYNEDADDVAIFDQRKAELTGADQHLPAEVVQFMLKGDSRMRAIRRWRGQTQMYLTYKTTLTQGYISDLESGRRAGSAEALAEIAKALDVSVEWLR